LYSHTTPSHIHNSVFTTALEAHPLKESGSWTIAIIRVCGKDNLDEEEEACIRQYYGVLHHTDMYHRDGVDRHRWGYNICKGGAAGQIEIGFLLNGYRALQTPTQLVGTLSDNNDKYIHSRRNDTSYCVQDHPVQINRLLEPLRKQYNIPTLPILASTREEVVAIRHKLTMILQHWTDYFHQ
jgi:hypothetical protein